MFKLCSVWLFFCLCGTQARALVTPSCHISLVSLSLAQLLGAILSLRDPDTSKSGNELFCRTPLPDRPGSSVHTHPTAPIPSYHYTLGALPTSWPRGEGGTSSPPRALGATMITPETRGC